VRSGIQSAARQIAVNRIDFSGDLNSAASVSPILDPEFKSSFLALHDSDDRHAERLASLRSAGVIPRHSHSLADFTSDPSENSTMHNSNLEKYIEHSLTKLRFNLDEIWCQESTEFKLCRLIIPHQDRCHRRTHFEMCSGLLSSA
jgi:hypothetical protein